MKTHLRAHIKDKLNAIELSDAQYRALSAQRARLAAARFRPIVVGRRRQWSALASGVVLAVGLVLYMGWLTPVVETRVAARSAQQVQWLAQAIAEEAVANHLKARPLELVSRDMGELQAFFTELDFKPINSQLWSTAGGSLLGGRYCSIQGIGAAQLRFQPADGRDTHSLYQTVWREDKFGGLPVLDHGERPITAYARGMAVQVWVERGVVFAKTLPVTAD